MSLHLRAFSLRPEGGRSFVLNDDGSMSPEKARHLALGVDPPDCTLVQKGAAERLVLDSPRNPRHFDSIEGRSLRPFRPSHKATRFPVAVG